MARGNSLTSAFECKVLHWKLQGESFNTYVMLIALGGCEMVLRIQWASDFRKHIVEF